MDVFNGPLPILKTIKLFILFTKNYNISTKTLYREKFNLINCENSYYVTSNGIY